MPGARPPQPKFLAAAPQQQAIAKTLKDVGRALSQANNDDLLSLKKKQSLPRSCLKEADGASTVVFYCSINAVLSAALIAFNKYLMHEGRFPYPVPLVVLHTSACSIFAALFLLLHSHGGSCRVGTGDLGFFSTLPQALADNSFKTKVIGLACLFAAQLVFSNAAFLYSSVVFIQLMKESNLTLVYALSVLASLEVIHWQRIRVLLCIIFATLLTIKGELNFTWIGFAIQLTGQSFEGMRIVMQAVVLNAKGLNLDVLTYMLLVMPVCALILMACLIFNTFVWQVGAIATPTWQTSIVWWPELLANALLAVALNFSTALVVKHASAVGLVLSGIMKDTAIIMAGAYFLEESITSIQVLGFTLQILGILVYSFIKLYPDMFADGIFVGFKRILGIEASVSAPIEESCYGTAST